MARTMTEIVSQREFSDEDILAMLQADTPEDCSVLQKAAYDRTTELLGDAVYFRGLIEVSNICTASCRYCGIRRLNHSLPRYELTREQIVGQAVWAAEKGYGSVCLQAGERHDPKFVAFITGCLKEISERTRSDRAPNGVGITLSLGDQDESVYAEWADACANRESLRYLSRFETSNPQLFAMLHSSPGRNEKNLERRFECLRALRRCGYQVGTGVMIGIPGQTCEDLVRDIRTYQQLDADMIGQGPYLMSEGGELQHLGQMEPGRLMRLTLNVLAATRLVLGNVNMASATALDALVPGGRDLGLMHGCNVIMPNLSPTEFRAGYQLYDNKPALTDSPEHNPFDRRIIACGRRPGWHLFGSSRHYLRRTGRPNE